MTAQFAQLIKIQRYRLNLDQQEVADSLGISVTHLSDIERCRQSPPIDRIPQIADILGLSVDTLYLRAGVLPPDIVEMLHYPDTDRFLREACDKLRKSHKL